MNTTSWLDNMALGTPRASLRKDISADIAIIGGGLAGTLTAYLLCKAGKKAVILEKKDISDSITAYTTAWLNCVIDTDLTDLVQMYGDEGARNVWRSGMDAIDLIEKIANEEGIDCDFQRVSHYRLADSKSDMEMLEREHEQAARLGFETALHRENIFAFPGVGSLEIMSQAKFHPIKFLIGLQKAAERHGAAIYENTEALTISGDADVTVKTKQGSVTAGYAVIATYQPFEKIKELFAHTASYTSYVFEAEIPKDLIPEGLYEDEKNPYHYFRIDAGQASDRMILGGEDHRKEIPVSKEKNFRALESYLADLVPQKSYAIKRRWSGPILETIDGLAYIGNYSSRYPRRLIATGFSGNGMTYSAIAASIIRDIILKKENPYINLYHAGRTTRPYNFFIRFLSFAGEFFGGAARNFFR